MKLVPFILLIYVSVFGQQTEKDDINTLLNNWHQAASSGDEDVFFDFTMADDAVYIGTDSSELWTRDQMKEWSKQFFDRDTAWDFKVISRNIYFSKNKKVVWFDELLDTWMGACRGSGVLEKEKGLWKLKHYHLAIAVPNDVVDEYLKLISTSDSISEN